MKLECTVLSQPFQQFFLKFFLVGNLNVVLCSVMLFNVILEAFYRMALILRFFFNRVNGGKEEVSDLGLCHKQCGYNNKSGNNNPGMV